jgi:hypothetical protein
MSEITDVYTSGKVKIGELERKKQWEILYILERDDYVHFADEAIRAQELADEGWQVTGAHVIRFSPAEERAVEEYNRMLEKARHLSKRAKKVRQRRKNWKRLMRLYMQQHKYLR